MTLAEVPAVLTRPCTSHYRSLAGDGHRKKTAVNDPALVLKLQKRQVKKARSSITEVKYASELVHGKSKRKWPTVTFLCKNGLHVPIDALNICHPR